MAATNNQLYDNFFLANEVEDQYNSKLNLLPFVTIDNTLQGVAGMKYKVNVYSATNATEKVTTGNGNSKSIEVKLTNKEYEIALAQNRFEYYDEQAKQDPYVPIVGMKHAGVDMFNTVQKDIYEEFKKATLSIESNKADFNAFVDALAKLNFEDNDGKILFAFVHPKDVALLRKNLKDDLKYNEAYVRTGYIGTVAGVNIYTKKDATEKTIIVSTNKAVTIFNKTGVEVEQAARGADEANTRINTIFSRKYYLAALTDETQVVKITITGTGLGA